MARKPNYDFERREREKAKAAKKEERAKAKAERRDGADSAKAVQPSEESGNADQIAHWNSEVGERWAALQERVDAVLAPISTALLALAAPQPGSRVLDIGCGAGATVTELARLVGPTGRVCGIDVSKPMLAVARRRVEAEALGHVDLLLADATSEPFAVRSFDLAVSRFGVMFFADPVGAFTNIRRGLSDAGRIAFACWQPMAASAWFDVPASAVRAMLPPASPVDPLAPGPFAFASPDRVRGILEAAGFEQITIEPHVAALSLGDAAAATDFVTRIGPTSRLIAEADPDRRPALMEAVRAALIPYGPDEVVLSGAVWLVSARRGVTG